MMAPRGVSPLKGEGRRSLLWNAGWLFLREPLAPKIKSFKGYRA
jgi:hypothetical protein